MTSMENRFWSANAFNQPLGKWKTGKVTDMSHMFYDAIQPAHRQLAYRQGYHHGGHIQRKEF